MSGFLQRIIDLIRASLNSLIDKAEDPEKMLEQMMRDMQANYRRSKIEVAKVLAEKHRLRAQMERSEKDSTAWERKAVLALKAGDEGLARKALERKRASKELATGLSGQYEEQALAADRLLQALTALENKIAEVRVKRSLLSSRHRRALAQQKIQKALELSCGPTAFDSIARLEAHVEDLEAETTAVSELKEATLEGRFLKLGEVDVESDLLALKSRLAEPALLASSSSGEAMEPGTQPSATEKAELI